MSFYKFIVYSQALVFSQPFKTLVPSNVVGEAGVCPHGHR